MNAFKQFLASLLVSTSPMDAYLARAKDIADLERRMRQMDAIQTALIFPGR